MVNKNRRPYDNKILMLCQTLRGLTLTADQAQALQDVYSVIFEARLDYELRIAKAAKLSPTETLIETPSYSQFGAQLKGDTKAMFLSTLGDQLGSKVYEQLSPYLESSNDFYGQYPRSILVNYDKTLNLYKVTRTTNLAASGSPSNGPTLEFDDTIPPDNLGIYDKFSALFPKP